MYNDPEYLINLSSGAYQVTLTGNLRVFAETDLDKVLVGVNLRFINDNETNQPIYLTGFKQPIEAYPVSDLDTEDLNQICYLNSNYNFSITKIFKAKCARAYAFSLLVKVLGGNDSKVSNVLVESSRLDLVITKLR